MDDVKFAVRPYRSSDRPAVRRFAGGDEFARPQLASKYPGMREYVADGLSHYYDLEPESCFVAEADGEFIGNLLGAIDTLVTEGREKTYLRRLRSRQGLFGAYGIPVWLIPVIRTDRAPRITEAPDVDLRQYPAHLHMGVKREWRGKGVGRALMDMYEEYLRGKCIPGFHLYASSFHYEGVSFYRKIGLHELGDFKWRFHDGFTWLTVTEHVFVKNLG